MITDWSILYIAIPAVIMTGLSKGGIASGLGMLGTPLIALVVPPLQAASIMLPMLLVMDAVGVYSFWRHADWLLVRMILPFGILGIGFGWMSAHLVDDNGVRILLGLIAIVFAVNEVRRDIRKLPAAEHNLAKAGFWGTISGFTSFVSHAGGPPYQAYSIPLRLETMRYMGSNVIFFATINALKWPVYFSLGELNIETLKVSATLLPFGLVGVLAGVWAVKRLPQDIFYRITYIAMFAVGAKLIWDGLSGLSLAV